MAGAAKAETMASAGAKVVSPQGLILLKSLRGSGQDQDDIEYLRSLEDED